MVDVGLYGSVLTYSFNKYRLSIYTVPGAGVTRVGQIEKSPIMKFMRHYTCDRIW